MSSHVGAATLHKSLLPYIGGVVNDDGVAVSPLDGFTNTCLGGTVLGICTGHDERLVLSDFPSLIFVATVMTAEC